MLHHARLERGKVILGVKGPREVIFQDRLFPGTEQTPYERFVLTVFTGEDECEDNQPPRFFHTFLDDPKHTKVWKAITKTDALMNHQGFIDEMRQELPYPPVFNVIREASETHIEVEPEPEPSTFGAGERTLELF